MKRSLLGLILIFIAGSFVSCAGGQRLRTVAFDQDDRITGQFRVVFIGANHSNDIATMVVLDRAGDSYDIVPYMPDSDYYVMENLEGSDAVALALKHIRSVRSYGAVQYRRIEDQNGLIIGYELRASYRNYLRGLSRPVDVDYWLTEKGHVRVLLNLSPEAERLYLQGGGD